MYILVHVPKFVGPVKTFWARPKIQLHLVPLQNILCLHKNCIYQMEIIFWSVKKVSEPAEGQGGFRFSKKVTKIVKKIPVSSNVCGLLRL